jgi:mRNA interferase MazF
MRNDKALSAAQIKPKRGEIWRVNLEPTIGAEMQKDNRPVLVLSRPSVGEPTVRICAPIIDFKPQRDALRFWRVAIGDSKESGLTKISCADVSQTRALDLARFISKDGKAHEAEIEATSRALAEAVGVIVPANQSKENEA